MGIGKALFAILKIVYGICRLEHGPQDLPKSRYLAPASMAAYLLCQISVGFFYRTPLGAIQTGILDAVLLGAVTWCLLLPRGKLKRFNQTLSALMLTGIAVSIVNLVVMLALSFTPFPESKLIGFTYLLTFPLVLWNLLLKTHILRHAMEIPFTWAMGIALTIWLILDALKNAIAPIVGLIPPSIFIGDLAL